MKLLSHSNISDKKRQKRSHSFLGVNESEPRSFDSHSLAVGLLPPDLAAVAFQLEARVKRGPW